MLTFNGHLYTCGAKENGKLGHGSQGSSGNLGRITRVTKFLDCDEQTDMDVRIGYVSTQKKIILQKNFISQSKIVYPKFYYMHSRLHWGSHILLLSVKI